jgi:hypothetical protein
MRGIPNVRVVVGRNGAPAAFDMFDPCTRTRITVHIDGTMQSGAAQTGAHAPNYAARGYRMRPASCRIDVCARYPRCAGWSDGFGSTQS